MFQDKHYSLGWRILMVKRLVLPIRYILILYYYYIIFSILVTWTWHDCQCIGQARLPGTFRSIPKDISCQQSWTGRERRTANLWNPPNDFLSQTMTESCPKPRELRFESDTADSPSEPTLACPTLKCDCLQCKRRCCPATGKPNLWSQLRELYPNVESRFKY